MKYAIRNARIALYALALALPWPGARAQNSAADTSVKMAFVYNLAKFTEWPIGAAGPGGRHAVLCVAGDAEPFAAGLAALEGRPLGGREIRVRRIGRTLELAGCQILYISRSEDKRVTELLAQAHPLAVLTVSDLAEFADEGGIIGLVTVDNKVQFDINLRSSRQAGLKISSEVLKLARSVVGR